MKYRLMVFPGRRVVGDEHEYELLARAAAIDALPVMPGCSVLVQQENERTEPTAADRLLGRPPWLPVDYIHRFPDGSALWDSALTEAQSREWCALSQTQESAAQVGNEQAHRALDENETPVDI